MIRLLYEAGFLEGTIGAVLLDSAEAARRDSDGNGPLEFRHVDALLLEVRVSADIAARIELGRASAIGVAAAHDRGLFGYCADFSHKSDVRQYAIIHPAFCK